MGHSVTIEGSLTPCVELERGERRTVTVTQHIRNLVRIGAVVVVEGSLNAPSSTAAPEPEGAPEDLRTDADEQADGDGPDADGVPAGNASREKWAKFLRSKNIEFPDDKTAADAGDEQAWAGRDDLKIIWQQATGGS